MPAKESADEDLRGVSKKQVLFANIAAAVIMVRMRAEFVGPF
jgi:hypothetical protein